MSKQVQEAYIVAATRTPIGKSGRGVFRHTRPDDLLVAAIRGALKQVPSLETNSRAIWSQGLFVRSDSRMKFRYCCAVVLPPTPWLCARSTSAQ